MTHDEEGEKNDVKPGDVWSAERGKRDWAGWRQGPSLFFLVESEPDRNEGVSLIEGK